MTPVVTASLGALVLLGAAGMETRGFAVLGLPTGSEPLLGCSSGLVPVGGGAPGVAGEAVGKKIKVLYLNERAKVWSGCLKCQLFLISRCESYK